jgi:predicted metal-dependent hydrolase
MRKKIITILICSLPFFLYANSKENLILYAQSHLQKAIEILETLNKDYPELSTDAKQIIRVVFLEISAEKQALGCLRTYQGIQQKEHLKRIETLSENNQNHPLLQKALKIRKQLSAPNQIKKRSFQTMHNIDE